MTSIMVYADTAKMVEELAERLDTTVADVIDTLVSDYGEELE